MSDHESDMLQILILGVCPLLSSFLCDEISHYLESERHLTDLLLSQSFHFELCDNHPMFISKRQFALDYVYSIF